MMRILLSSVSLIIGSSLFAADSAAVAKSKEVADTAIKTAAIKSIEKLETDHLLIYAVLPSAKLKPIGDLAEKSFQIAAKTLKVEKPDELFKGKLAVFLIPERRAYANLGLALSGKKPDSAELNEVVIRGDLPFVEVGMALGEKFTDAEWQQQAACWVATAVLNKKLGTDPVGYTIPDWAAVGFGKIAALKAENNSMKWTNYRTKSKSLVTGKLRGAVKINDIWSGTKGKEYDTFAMSVVESMAFNGEPDQFVKLMSGFKQTDTNPMPTIQSVLAGLEWKWEDLDSSWKQFILKAK